MVRLQQQSLLHVQQRQRPKFPQLCEYVKGNVISSSFHLHFYSNPTSSSLPTGWLVVEVMWTRLKRSISTRSTRFNSTTRYCVVPLARLGLHTQTGNDDDQTERTPIIHVRLNTSNMTKYWNVYCYIYGFIK